MDGKLKIKDRYNLGMLFNTCIYLYRFSLFLFTRFKCEVMFVYFYKIWCIILFVLINFRLKIFFIKGRKRMCYK